MEHAEWRDTKRNGLQSLLANSEPVTRGKGFLSLPTLTTGNGTTRNAGKTKLEDKLKKLGIVPPGYQLSPEAMAMYMGFPWALFAPITGQRFTEISGLFPMGYEGVMMPEDLLAKASHHPKPRCHSTSSTGTISRKRGRPKGKASGCLIPFTETRYGKTYPTVQGERVPKDLAFDYPHHYRWYYQWRQWDEHAERWSTQSKRIHASQVNILRQLIQARQGVQRILDFIHKGKLYPNVV